MSYAGDGEFAQGRAINRPPRFNGDNFAHWKILMKMFIMDQDIDLWSHIEDGPPIFYHRGGDKDGQPKLPSEYTETERDSASKGYKLTHMLFCSLSSDEFCRVSTCSTPKEIWDTLVVTYEGTSQVKQSKIDMLMREYELFKMKPEEDIKGMYRRFSDIVNNLHSLEKKFSNEEKVRKLLRSLPKGKWEAKVTAIEEAQNLSTLSLHDLQGKLLTYEMSMKDSEEDLSYNMKNLALKVKKEDKPQKKFQRNFQSFENDSSEDEEVGAALLSKALGRFLRKKKNFSNKDFNKDYKDKYRSSQSKDPRGKDTSYSNRNKSMNCFECGEEDHLVRDCPQKKRKLYSSRRDKDQRKKAMVATTWSESEESGSESEQDNNLCLVAGLEESDKVIDSMVKNLLSSPISILPEILKNMFLNEESYRVEIESLKAKVDKLSLENHNLISKVQSLEIAKADSDSCFKALDSEYKALNLQVREVVSINNDLTEKCDQLEETSSKLSKELQDSQKILSNFASSEKYLKLMLGSCQRIIHKTGLGFESNVSRKDQTIFVKARKHSGACFYCNRKGHKKSACPFRTTNPQILRNTYPYALREQVKQIWVKKGVRPFNMLDPDYDSKFYTWSNSQKRK